MSYLFPNPTPIANGGTGATTQADAISASGGTQTCTVSQTTVSPTTIGTISGASWSSSSPVITFTSASVTLVPGMCFSTTGLTTVVIKTVDSPTQITLASNPSNTQTNVTVVVLNSTLTTMQVTGLTAVDGRTLLNNDSVLVTGSTVQSLRGPWVVTSAGSPANLTRPSWFSGNLNSPVQISITEGGTFRHFLYIVGLPTNTVTTQIGIETINVFTLNGRATNASTSGNTFTGKQTLQSGSLGSGAVPYSFQAGVLMTTPQAHSVEWDGVNEYVSTGAVFTASISAFTMTVTSVTTNNLIQIGQLLTGNNVSANTYITGFVSGTNGGVGVYTVSVSQVAASGTVTGTIRTTIGTFINGASGTYAPNGSVAVPSSSASPGRAGQLAYDATGLYVCTLINGVTAWKRVNWDTF